MNISKNTFKKLFQDRSNPTAKIQNPKSFYGCWNGLVDTNVAEILAGSGFDWVLIDGEHAPFDLRTIQHQLQAMGQFDTPILVRPPHGDTHLIKQYLDIGVQTLLVPMIETAEQAAQCYQAMQYPPKGVRGVGTALARAAQWNRVNNYFKTAGDEMCLIVQVESVKGIENLESIVHTEGVDGVFIGPYLVTADEFDDFTNLQIQTRVNGELRQNDNTSRLMFPFDYIISYLSTFMTLKAGDMIATGTPNGAGARFAPPQYLKPNDVVEITATGLGILRNGVEDEKV